MAIFYQPFLQATFHICTQWVEVFNFRHQPELLQSQAKMGKLAFYNHFLEKIRIICQNQTRQEWRKLLFSCYKTPEHKKLCSSTNLCKSFLCLIVPSFFVDLQTHRVLKCPKSLIFTTLIHFCVDFWPIYFSKFSYFYALQNLF